MSVRQDEPKRVEESNNKSLLICKACKSENVVRDGTRKTENRGSIQKFLCNDCGKRFCHDDGFFRMRNSESKITQAIDLYFSNLSSRKVRNFFRRHLEHNASHVTILDWCRRYTLRVQKYVDTLTPSLSGEYYADETEIDREGKKDNFWCSVDWGTRFINAIYYSPLDQSVAEATTFFEKVKKSGKPKYIQTDAAQFYPQAFTNTFFSIYGRRDEQPRHIVNNVSRTGRHNVRIETVFSKIKDRTTDFRGLKALWSAPILMAGIVIQHNWIEAHTTTGRIPAELAEIKIDTGANRWLGMIKVASRR